MRHVPLLSALPEPVKRPLRPAKGVVRRGYRAARATGRWVVAGLPRLPEPTVDGVRKSVLLSMAQRLATQRHFGARDLERLEAMLRQADLVVPLGEAFEQRDHWPERFAALRHDLDHDIENAVRMAEWEAERGFRSTYFVLHTEWYWGSGGSGRPSTLVLRALDRIASLGHEIGVHNNAITEALVHGGQPVDMLGEVLTGLRRHGFHVRGTAAHGDGLCRKVGYVNYELFDDCRHPDGLAPNRSLVYADPRSGKPRELELHPVPMASLGLDYEAYFIGHTLYLSESEARWNLAPDSMAEQFVGEGGFLQILTHPVHWAFGDEIVRPIPTLRTTPPAGIDPTVSDPHAPSFPILVRGDCCSRRAVLMNRDLFGGNPVMTRDEKSRTDFFLDHLVVGSPSIEDVNHYLDLDRLVGSHRHYAMTQTTRDTLDVDAARLIVMDSYADTNFKAWRHREQGWKLWIYPLYLRDKELFERDFEPVDYLSLDEAAELNAQLIARYRSQVGEVPVLYLIQPTAYYRKLDHRQEFNGLGAAIAKRAANVFVGDVDPSVLEPDDMGSSGPGQTLHFKGPTYRKMIQVAMDNGLGEWLRASATSPA